MKFAAAKPPFLEDLKANTAPKVKTFKSFQAAVNRYERHLQAQGEPDADLEFAFAVTTLESYKNYLSLSCHLLGQTVRAQFSALKCFWNYAAMKGWVDQEAAPFSKVKLPKKVQPVREHTNNREVSLLFDAAQRHYSERDAAFDSLLVSTFVHTGVRAEECTNIEMGHINLEEETLEVRYGKGDKNRILHPPAEWFYAFNRFRVFRDAMGCTHPYLFAQGPKMRISDERIRVRLEQLKAVAGLKGQNGVKPHSLRHFFAKNMEKNGAPLEVIQHALGHEHMETTLIYLRSGGESTEEMKKYASFPVPEMTTAESHREVPPCVAAPPAVALPPVAAPEPLSRPEPIKDGPATVVLEAAEAVPPPPNTDCAANPIQSQGEARDRQAQSSASLEPTVQAERDRPPRRCEPPPSRRPDSGPVPPDPYGPGRPRPHLRREHLASRRYSGHP